ncbi:MAG TPA: hypothetical protein VFL41_11035 [Gaiellaceae bacterium]|nr:hypothetical protein [Gaiellaceae bacterium]
MSTRRLELLPAAVFCVLMTIYVYAWVHQPEPDYSNEPENAIDVIVPTAVLVLHLATGFAIGRWWALVLALFPVVVAIPAGDYPGGWPELPVAFTMISEEVVGLLALAGGVLARRLLEHRRERHAGTQSRA